MVMRALRQKLVLDLDGAKPRCFRRLYGESDMHGITPSADSIHDKWQFARRPDLDSGLDDVWHTKVSFQKALYVTQPPGASIKQLDPGFIRQLRRQRVENSW